MAHAVGDIASGNISLGVDPVRTGAGSAGEVDRSEVAIAQQKAMRHSCEIIRSNNIALRIECYRCGVRGSGKIDGAELASAQ